jgi:hypothetical protein
MVALIDRVTSKSPVHAGGFWAAAFLPQLTPAGADRLAIRRRRCHI